MCIKVVRGKLTEVHPLLWAVAIAFVVYFMQDWIRRRSWSDDRRLSHAPASRPVDAAGAPSVDDLPVPSAAMFERTALPAGPRVISSRLARGAFGLHRGVRPGRLAPGIRRPRPASPTSWSTSRSRARRRTRRTRAISEAIEGVGGSFNAATDRESTVYWVRVPRREARRAMDVLGELIVRPVLATAEIEGERTVIIEEIRSYRDDPSEYAQILFQTALFGDGPLGREICGDEAGIRALPDGHDPRLLADDVPTRPTRSSPSPATSSTSEAVDLAGRGVRDRATARSRASTPAPTCPPASASDVGKRDTAQAQLVVGLPALRRDHPDSWTLRVLNAVLGDGMSSRLFLSVREERGLAYDIGSGLVEYADAGALEVSAGVDPAGLQDALAAILAELARLRDELVPAEELDKAKRYLAGGLELRMDDTRHVASWIGGQEALHDRVLTLDEALAAIDAVTADDIQRLAGDLFRDEGLRLAAVAPARYLRGLERHLRLPA